MLQLDGDPAVGEKMEREQTANETGKRALVVWLSGTVGDERTRGPIYASKPRRSAGLTFQR